MNPISGRGDFEMVELLLPCGKEPGVPCQRNDQDSPIAQANLHGIILKLERKNGWQFNMLPAILGTQYLIQRDRYCVPRIQNSEFCGQAGVLALLMAALRCMKMMIGIIEIHGIL